MVIKGSRDHDHIIRETRGQLSPTVLAPWLHSQKHNSLLSNEPGMMAADTPQSTTLGFMISTAQPSKTQ